MYGSNGTVICSSIIQKVIAASIPPLRLHTCRTTRTIRFTCYRLDFVDMLSTAASSKLLFHPSRLKAEECMLEKFECRSREIQRWAIVVVCYLEGKQAKRLC
jgi:hypothetical protein